MIAITVDIIKLINCNFYKHERVKMSPLDYVSFYDVGRVLNVA